VQLAAKCALLMSVLSFSWTGRCFCKSEWSKHDRLHTICSSVIFGAFFFERKGVVGLWAAEQQVSAAAAIYRIHSFPRSERG
jgi:hypothetical protein